VGDDDSSSSEAEADDNSLCAESAALDGVFSIAQTPLSTRQFRPITGLGSSDPRHGRSETFDGRSGSRFDAQELGYIKQKNINTQSATTEVVAMGQVNDSQELILEEGQKIHKRVDVTASRTK
jgi:hypothetical protein